MKFQANIPFKLTKLFYEKLGEQPVNKRVLVIRDLFTAMHASIDNAVTFVTDDEEACELFNKNVASNDEFGNNDTAIFVDTEINKNAWKDFIKELTNMPKFDVAIMNPPYDRNLHLKILEAVIPIAEETINISPIDAFVDINFENSVSKRIAPFVDNIKVFSEKESNDLFKIYNSCKLGIIKCKAHAKGVKPEFDNLRSVIERLRKQKSIRSSLNYKKDGFFTYVQGDYGYAKSWHYTLEQIFIGKHVNATISFETENELENFENATINCWPYKLMYIVDNKSAVIAHLPFMSDYTQPWDDKRFCEYFGITGYISDTEAEPNSEWEIILNTMKEYV